MNRREIKFRAWDEQENKMVYDFIAARGTKASPYLDSHRVLVRSTWYTLIQFTGLHDKNGKEVYEGYLVLLDGSKKPKEVNYCRGGFFLDNIYGGAEAYRMEVIGNIYENPELLPN
jgi:uncharacterized phage protein (TIGR01671 family)